MADFSVTWCVCDICQLHITLSRLHSSLFGARNSNAHCLFVFYFIFCTQTDVFSRKTINFKVLVYLKPAHKKNTAYLYQRTLLKRYFRLVLASTSFDKQHTTSCLDFKVKVPLLLHTLVREDIKHPVKINSKYWNTLLMREV